MPDLPTGRAPLVQPAVRGLFQQRVAGDDALLRLTQLRFAQAGLSAEVYADTPEQLDRLLGFAPSEQHLPTVHLSRGVNVLHANDRAAVGAFADRFAGRIWGLVVHDKAEMARQPDAVVDALAELSRLLDAGPDRPHLFLEYAAGLELDWFVELAQRLRNMDRISVCVDVGHVGVSRARRSFRRLHPDIDLAALHPQDARLPELAGAVRAAVESALPAVLDTARALGDIGKPVHFHLHDGHPLVPGLPDHFGFLVRLPVPFPAGGRRSLDPMYGPTGLAAILRTAVDACGAGRASFTLEIHQAEGRLPLDDAAGLFQHWRDTTNAERTNYWLSVLSQNAMLVTSFLEPARRRTPEDG
jgi:hypothetical protein